MTTVDLGRPTTRRPPFKFSAFTRVGFSDTDAQSIVYYGRYLPYFDLARVEYLRHLELLDPDLGPRQFVMRASTVEYHAPAVFDDLLEIFVRISRMGNTSSTWSLRVHRAGDDELMCTADQVLVLIDLAARKPATIPESFRADVRRFEAPDLDE
jgi:acyl-CoA thioester hydrolase